jgi:hypothetical protein
MNKIIAITFIAFAGVFSLLSCKSSSNQDIVNNTNRNSVSASINDASFSVSGTAVTAEYFDTSIVNAVYIAGVSGDTTVSIILSNYNTAIPKYLVDTSSTAANILLMTPGSTLMLATTGTIQISSATSTSVTGTFSCTFPNTAQITNGKFSAIW